MNSALDAILQLFHDHHSFVLTTHVNPDGDGLGSEVAIAEWLAAQGKQVSILNSSPTPDIYLFLDPHHRIKQFNEHTDAETIANADVIVVVDTNHLDRLRTMQGHVAKSKAIKVCIDHHLDPEPFARHLIIDEEATSTGEIVYHLLVKLFSPAHLSPIVARALYCAILTDTGSFRYPRVVANTHHIVAHLIECGADPVSIYNNVYEQWSAGRIQLLGAVLSGLRMEYDGQLAHVSITQEMLKSTSTIEEDADNFTVYPMSVGGVAVGILFLELKDGLKISFRSKGDIPINELAKEFGGNGHKNAAGARIHNKSLEEVRTHVITAASKYVATKG
ncbi:MAG: DHH family phosphoesterase [Bacteroidota bacterium]